MSGDKMKKGCFLLSILIALLAVFAMEAKASEEISSFSILEVREKGMFNIGPAIGDVISEPEESAGKNVFKYDYTIFGGAITGVWTKGFPENLKPGTLDAVKIGIKVSNKEQLEQVSVKLEIKGNKAWQVIPLRIKEGWVHVREEVEWDRIGDLTEVVFVVSPFDVNKKLEGIIYFDLDFYKLTLLEKYFILIKIALVLVFSIVIAFFFGLFKRAVGRN